mgnify:CR=1 FL=1
MTAAPADRAFAVFGRGDQAKIELNVFRNRLRLMTNPETGQPFTELEIATATAPGTRWANGADADDLIALASQARALVLADQMDPLRANSEFLRGQWCRRTGLTPRPPAGGSGSVTLAAAVGSVFVGSTTIGDPAATFGISDAGLRFQVLYTVVVGVSGTATIEVVGVDTGPQTNLAAGALLRPANGPIGWTVPGSVVAKFTGGRNDETDAELAQRIAWQLKHKQAAGNNADFRGWAESASASVEAAFVYAAALAAGSLLVAVTQARGNVLGPLGRIPNAATLIAARAAVTPPGSSQVPAHPYVVLTGVTGTSVDTVTRLSMAHASDAGWTDLEVWPGTNDDGDPCTITTLTTQTNFRITIPAGSLALPTGVTQPTLMVWDATLSRFESLKVLSVVLFGGSVYTVTLNAAPTATLAVGSWISPDAVQREVIGETIEAFFDTLGPGEVVPLTSSLVGTRAQRFPSPTEEYPQRAGTTLETYLDDALGAALGDRDLPYVSVATPPVPADPASGPAMLVAGRAAVYALDS